MLLDVIEVFAVLVFYVLIRQSHYYSLMAISGCGLPSYLLLDALAGWPQYPRLVFTNIDLCNYVHTVEM